MPYRFVFDDQQLHDLALAHVHDDMRAARLSRKFRAYYRLRPFIPIPLRRLLQRHRQVDVADRWCFPDCFCDQLRNAIRCRSEPLSTIHPWPDAARYAVVVTHDVEESEGFERIAQIAALEEDLGFRSCWNIVPYKYRVDFGLVRDLQARGFEIGIHGYNHDGQLYASRRTFERRAIAINDALRKYHAVGFRSPMVHRNLQWLQALDVQYDSSCFDIDPYQAMPGGVGSIWPFQFGRFVELPYTLPQDHTLFVVRGERDGTTWSRKLDFVMRYGGMALLLTHPDYLNTDRRLKIYRDFLASIRTGGEFWHALPREVAEWFQVRRRALAAPAMSDDTVSGGSHDSRLHWATVHVTESGLKFQAVARRRPSAANRDRFVAGS
jgi:peptidoglycan/xylan/chitin deacetylase (PgdA/CDA1 family)